IPLIFCLVSSSTFFTASLQAATTMSCSISTSPATSGSIFTASTFLWPSILTVTIPPPADASMRMRATSCCMRSCICCAFCIIDCMLPGSFTSLLLKISNRSNLPAKDFLESLHFRIGECARGGLILGGLLHLDGRGCLARGDLDPHRTTDDTTYRLAEVVRFHSKHELFGRRELQL